MDDESWRLIAEEFGRREGTAVTAALEATRIDASWVADSLAYLSSGRDGLWERAVACWRDAGVTGEAALLVAVYVYVRTQQAWELSVNHAPIRQTVHDALASWRSLRPATDPDADPDADPDGDPDAQADATVVELMLRHAASLAHCMEAENALNCSCPVALAEQASMVAEQSRELLRRSAGLPRRWHGFRDAFLDTVLHGHLENYAALDSVGEAVGLWIDKGRGAASDVEAAITFLRGQEALPAIRDDVYGSELRSHRRVLETIAARLADDSIPTVVLDEASVAYCYPFALTGIAGADAMRRARERLGAQDSELSDGWAYGWTREPSYQCVTVRVPDLTVHTMAGEALAGHEVEVRLSRLGNHAVYIRRRFSGDPATLHDVNQAMRRGSLQMGPERVIVAPDPVAPDTAAPDPARPAPPAGPWRRLPSFAEDLVTWLVGALNADGDALPHPAPGRPAAAVISPVMDVASQFHVTLEVRRLSVLDDDGVAAPGDVPDLLAAGAPLLLNSIRSNASGLEEWVRGSVEPHTNIAGDLGFAGDLVVRTANTTVLAMTGTPNWVMIGREEQVDFVASLPPLLQLWRQSLDPDTHVGTLDPDDTDEVTLAQTRIRLQQGIRRVRRELAVLHSVDLVQTASQRAFLDRLYKAAGLDRLQNQLIETLDQVEASHHALAGYITVKEKQRDAGYQQRVQLVLMVISFFGIADVLSFISSAFPWITADRATLTAALVSAFGLAVALTVIVYKPAQDAVRLLLRLAASAVRRRRGPAKP